MCEWYNVYQWNLSMDAYMKSDLKQCFVLIQKDKVQMKNICKL